MESCFGSFKVAESDNQTQSPVMKCLGLQFSQVTLNSKMQLLLLCFLLRRISDNGSFWSAVSCWCDLCSLHFSTISSLVSFLFPFILISIIMLIYFRFFFLWSIQIWYSGSMNDFIFQIFLRKNSSQIHKYL